MFTGLVLKTGKLISLNSSGKPEITVNVSLPDRVNIGDSVAVNGACLTVISMEKNSYKFNLSRETLSLANFKDLMKGSFLNIELPLTLQDFLGGHLVSGHLDGTVRVKSIQKGSDSHRIVLSYTDKGWQKFLIHKGSVTLNGVSLTVSERSSSTVTVDIIPHTFESTNLNVLKKGERVNIEFDMIAKYLYNMQHK